MLYLWLGWALAAAVAVADTGDAETGDEEMVVDGQRRSANDRFSDPTSVTVIPVDERQSHASEVADVLHSVAGARVVHLGGLGDFSAVGLRGAGCACAVFVS